MYGKQGFYPEIVMHRIFLGSTSLLITITNAQLQALYCLVEPRKRNKSNLKFLQREKAALFKTGKSVTVSCCLVMAQSLPLFTLIKYIAFLNHSVYN